MKQWFSGRFEGHYRGLRTQPSSLAPYQDAEHFKIEVYEAIVSDLELKDLVVPPPTPVDDENPETEVEASVELSPEHEGRELGSSPEPTFHHEPRGRRFFQDHIPRAYLVDALQIGATVRAALHQVLVSEVEFSQPARHGDESYGRVEGTISGWFRPPPPPPEPLEEPAPVVPRPIGWETDVVASPSLRKQNEALPVARENDVRLMSAYRAEPADSEQTAAAAPWDTPDLEEPEENHAPVPFEVPFFTVGALVIGLMSFAAELKAAFIFGSIFLFAYGLRRWLSGVIPAVSGVRLTGFFLGALQVVVTAWLISSWSQQGCVSLQPMPLLVLVGNMLLTSVFPQSLAFAVSSSGFALVMLQAYGVWTPGFCS